jgi:glucose/arabinose dehydrogenase
MRARPLVAMSLIAAAQSISAQNQPTAPPPMSVGSTAGTLRIERLASLEYPWGIAVLPDGRALITEKPGRVRFWENGRLSAPIQGVPAVVYRDSSDQGGMLDVAIDPNFSTNRLVYLSYVEADPQGVKIAETGEMRFATYTDMSDSVVRGGAVARGRLDGMTLTDVQVIWRQVPKTAGRGHFGHRMAFAPDGKLFITSGDRMRFDPAANLKSNLGKVVRINADGSIPADNPFAGRDTALGDIWSYGHRNVLSANVDTEGRLWVIEMGPLGGDELNLIQRGRNYGWPKVSNGDNYDGSHIPDHGMKREYTAPARGWTPVISGSGGVTYTGALFGGWRGNLLLGGLSSMSLIRLQLDGERVGEEERLFMGRRIRDIAQATDGSLLVITDAKQGELLRLSPAAPSTATRPSR